MSVATVDLPELKPSKWHDPSKSVVHSIFKGGKLKSKNHTSHIWVSKEGLVSIEDKLFNTEDIRHIMYERRAADPQLTVSLKADEQSRMKLVSDIHNELRKADALALNYATLQAVN